MFFLVCMITGTIKATLIIEREGFSQSEAIELCALESMSDDQMWHVLYHMSLNSTDQ